MTKKSDRNDIVCVDEMMWCLVSTVIHESSRTALKCALRFISNICKFIFVRKVNEKTFSFDVNRNLQLQITLNPRYAKNEIGNASARKLGTNDVYSLKAAEKKVIRIFYSLFSTKFEARC